MEREKKIKELQKENRELKRNLKIALNIPLVKELLNSIYDIVHKQEKN